MMEEMIDIEKSKMSEQRIQYILKQFKKIESIFGGDTEMSIKRYRQLLTEFSEQYSKGLKTLTGNNMHEEELLVYDAVECEEVEAFTVSNEPELRHIKPYDEEVLAMVNVESYKAKDYAETKTVTAAEKPEGAVAIKRVDEVQINSGPRAGQKAIVIELEPDWTYWPNRTSVKTIADKFGNDSEKWIGKKIKITTEKMIVQGKKTDVLFAEIA